MKMKTAVIRQGSRGNLNHNRRELLGEEHIDYEIENEVFVRQTLQEAYHGAFGKAVEEYNSQQKRKDRRIDDYYKHLFKCDYSPIVQEATKRGKNKHAQKSFYENIIQIGNQYDTGVKRAPEDAKLATECLRLWFNGCPELNIPSYQERNPNIYVIESSIHVDEATPHIQLDYIPMSFINEKGNGKFGLSVQNSHSKALIEMGFGDDEYAIMRWREHEIEKYLVPIMESRGIGWIPPDKENKREYMEKPEYKRFMDRIEGEVEIERERLMSELEAVRSEKESALNGEIEEIKVKLFDYENLNVSVNDVSGIGNKQFIGKNIVVEPEKYELLQEQAKAYRVNQPKIIKIDESWRFLEEERKRLKAELEKAAKIRKEAEEMWDISVNPETFQRNYKHMEQEIAVLKQKNEDLIKQLKNSIPQAEHLKKLQWHEEYIGELRTELEDTNKSRIAERRELADVKAKLSKKYGEIQQLEQKIDELTPKQSYGKKL